MSQCSCWDLVFSQCRLSQAVVRGSRRAPSAEESGLGLYPSVDINKEDCSSGRHCKVSTVFKNDTRQSGQREQGVHRLDPHRVENSGRIPPIWHHRANSWSNLASHSQSGRPKAGQIDCAAGIEPQRVSSGGPQVKEFEAGVPAFSAAS